MSNKCLNEKTNLGEPHVVSAQCSVAVPTVSLAQNTNVQDYLLLWTSAPAVTNRQKSPTFRHELKKFLHPTDVTDLQYAGISFYDRILHTLRAVTANF